MQLGFWEVTAGNKPGWIGRRMLDRWVRNPTLHRAGSLTNRLVPTIPSSQKIGGSLVLPAAAAATNLKESSIECALYLRSVCRITNAFHALARVVGQSMARPRDPPVTLGKP